LLLLVAVAAADFTFFVIAATSGPHHEVDSSTAYFHTVTAVLVAL
jgi:hypothetical protein